MENLGCHVLERPDNHTTAFSRLDRRETSRKKIFFSKLKSQIKDCKCVKYCVFYNWKLNKHYLVYISIYCLDFWKHDLKYWYWIRNITPLANKIRNVVTYYENFTDSFISTFDNMDTWKIKTIFYTLSKHQWPPILQSGDVEWNISND